MRDGDKARTQRSGSSSTTPPSTPDARHRRRRRARVLRRQRRFRQPRRARLAHGRHSWLGIESGRHRSARARTGATASLSPTRPPLRGGIYQDVSLPTIAGDSLCADAEVVSCGAHPGAEAGWSLWLLGESKTQASVVNFGRLRGQEPLDRRLDLRDGDGRAFGVQDRVLRRPKGAARSASTTSMSTSPSSTTAVSTTTAAPGWHRPRATRGSRSRRAGKLVHGAYEGNEFGAVATSSAAGAIYQQRPCPITAGESLCADAEVVTAAAPTPGARARWSLSLLGRSPSQSSLVTFGPLPAKGQWTPVSTCVTLAGLALGLPDPVLRHPRHAHARRSTPSTCARALWT